MRKNYNIKVEGVQAESGSRLYEVVAHGQAGYIDVVEYAARPSDAIARLVHKGMIFNGPKKASLIAAISEVDEFRPSPIFDRIGWNGPHFVYPDGNVFSPEGVPGAAVIIDPKPGKVHSKGTLNGWLERVATPLSGHSICEFFMMIPFAGPLRHHTTRVENSGFELTGQKATAKSVLLQLMSSICGGSLGGEEGNFALTFAATAAGLECETQNYSDLAMIIDEGNLFELGQSPYARGRAFSQLLMALGKGQEKRRFGTTSQTFRFVFATASNETLLDIIGGTSSHNVVEAVADRLMTLSLNGREHGVFDRLPPGYEDTGDFIADLVNASTEQHGTAMRHYLQKLVDISARDLSTFRSRLEGHICDFRQEACIQANAGSARRVADAFGLVYAAGRLAQWAGALPKSFYPLASVLACYRLHRTATQPAPSPAARLRALLNDPEIINLDLRVPRLSDEQLAATTAFRHTNPQGNVEILIPPTSIRNLIPDWNRVRRDDYEVSRMMVREGDRYTTKRNVRRNEKMDRVVCFVMGSGAAGRRT